MSPQPPNATNAELRAIEPEDVAVSCTDEGIIVRSKAALGPGADRACERFVRAVMSVASATSLVIDRDLATAVIRRGTKGRGAAASAEPIEELAAALKAPIERLACPTLPIGVTSNRFALHRHGEILTTCEPIGARPGRLKFRHESITLTPSLAHPVADRLRSAQGVERVELDRRTLTFTVRHALERGLSARLLRLVEETIAEVGACTRTPPHQRMPGLLLANVNVGAAAAVEFAAPALAPVSAGLLLASSLRTFRLAWSEGKQGRLGVPAVYTVIVAATLLSGQFLAASLMYWLLRFWRRRLGEDLERERRRLLDECLPAPKYAAIVADDKSELLIEVERLKPGDRFCIAAGRSIPADGVIASGEAIVDEWSVEGVRGGARKRPGDRVLAGSSVLAGRLEVVATECDESTRAGAIARGLMAATSPASGATSPALRGERFAELAVRPTLAGAGLGLLVGDLSTALAILRPDYATGPGMVIPLETLRDASECLRKGVLLRRPDVLERLARAELIVIEDFPELDGAGAEVARVRTHLDETELVRLAASACRHLADARAQALLAHCRAIGTHVLDLPATELGESIAVTLGDRRIAVRDLFPHPVPLNPLVVEISGAEAGVIEFQSRSRRSEFAACVARIRDRTPAPIALVSDRDERSAGELARSLGIELHKGDCTPSDTARFVAACRDRGIRVVFVGRSFGPIGEIPAELTIALGAEAAFACESTSAAILQPSLEPLAELFEIVTRHEAKVRDAQRRILLPNILCVAGAFLFGFSGMAAVVLSNLGTLGVYSRSASSLREHSADRKRRELSTSAGGR